MTFGTRHASVLEGSRKGDWTSLESLPSDLLSEIVKRLDGEDHMRFPLICKAARDYMVERGMVRY